MHAFDYDIVVSGGGIAGLITTAAFGQNGFSVLCVDPTPPVTSAKATGADMRTTAILQPGQRMLEAAGLWASLAPHAAALETMRIIDAGGKDATPRIIKDFRSSDVSDLPFGWNLPNWLLRREMVARLKDIPTVTFQPGVSTTNYLGRTTGARVKLSTGETVKTRLVIAADGRDSPMRNAAGIDVTTRRYGQKALAFAVTHTVPHENVSTEIHRTGGPFTLVPLPDHDGMPASAVVWMDDAAACLRRFDLSKDAFEAEMSERSCQIFGPLTLASRRSIWPIISQNAREFTATRLALIAEAAHVVPPIGAQGLNMSLTDTASLLSLAQNDPAGLGTQPMLDTYEKARAKDIRLRVSGIDLLNRVSQLKTPAMRDARALGLNALYAATPVRKMLMQMGLGLRDES
ncbi:MAG: UbiH/UbiF family hydroxylase [Paracoccaceae bacterium]